MTVNYVGGVDYNQYQRYNNNIGVQNGRYVTYTNATQSDAFVSNTGETCTDGKDDGKIGFFSAVGNAIKGIGKTVVNGVKGMFTGKDGKFSLGKTLLSIGTAALCIAVPAVGVAACVVGGAMGAIQVGKGVYNAATATTDAEAKMAWQDVGGGAFTVAASVVGAKAGVKAVKATSTAGPNNMSALQSLDDVAAATGQKATIGQKAVALGKDMVSSTRNQVGKIRTTMTPYANTGKEIAQINKMRNANAKALAKQKAGKTLTDADLKAIADWDSLGTKGFSENALKFVQKQNEIGFNTAEALRHPIQTGKNAWAAGKNAWNVAKGKVTKANAQELWNGIQNTYNKNIKGQSLSQLGNRLTGTARNIWADLSTGKYSYPDVVSKYGFENVAQVIQYMGGTIYSSEAI